MDRRELLEEAIDSCAIVVENQDRYSSPKRGQWIPAVFLSRRRERTRRMSYRSSITSGDLGGVGEGMRDWEK